MNVWPNLRTTELEKDLYLESNVLFWLPLKLSMSWMTVFIHNMHTHKLNLCSKKVGWWLHWWAGKAVTGRKLRGVLGGWQCFAVFSLWKFIKLPVYHYVHFSACMSNKSKSKTNKIYSLSLYTFFPFSQVIFWNVISKMRNWSKIKYSYTSALKPAKLNILTRFSDIPNIKTGISWHM